MATTSLIQVSEAAADKLSEILKEQGEDGGMLRVMVTPTPNGGFQHVLGVESEPKDDDIVIEAHSISVVIDGESAPLLEGAEIDYVDGLMRSGFVISNPNLLKIQLIRIHTNHINLQLIRISERNLKHGSMYSWLC